METQTTLTAAMDGPYTPQQRKAIGEALEANRVASGLKVNQLSTMLGWHPSMYSRIIKGTYPGDIDKYLTGAVRWLNDRAEAAAAPAADYVETSIARRIIATCRRAVNRGTIARIEAPSGIGKSMALREFARQRGDRAAYIYAGENYSQRGALVREIALAVCQSAPDHMSSDRLFSRVRDTLRQFYGGGQSAPFAIIVDEAQTLTAASLNTLRNLHDDPACGAAIILAGTARLTFKLQSSHERGQYEQLNSRTRATWSMSETDPIDEADVDAVVAGTLAGLGCKSTLPAASLKFLRRLAGERGKLRNPVNRLRDVADMAEILGVRPTFSVAELDYVATLSGAEQQMVHAEPPFSATARPAAPQPRLATA
ncbi:MAG: AAA family ATPase [Planctomycetes bacterium]|nr:AAA family ATPase [Planctomycetota bacterium]